MASAPKGASRSIYLDSTAAEASIQRLTAQAEKLRAKITEGESAGKNMNKALNQLDQVNAQIKSVQEQLDKGLGPTLKQQETLVRNLRNELAKLAQNDPAFEHKLKNYQAQNEALKEMRSRIEGVEEANESLGGSMGRFLARMLEYAAAFFAFEKIKEFFAGTIEEINQAEEAASLLRNALENAGRMDVFVRLLAQADDFADRFKRLDNDDITKVFAKLVDYGKLTEKQITQLTEVIINYAAKQNISLEEASDVMTKALEGNGKSLKTYGINIKDATNFNERFNLVVGDLGNKLKGAEAAFEQTARGGWATFKQWFRDQQEAVGRFLYSLVGLEQQQQRNAVQAKNEADQGAALVAEYEKLSAKTNQTAEDKQRLQAIAASLAATFGSSVIEIDKETGALKLNVAATKDLIRQKLLLANSAAAEEAAKYSQALDEYGANAAEAAKNLEALRIKEKEYNISADATAKKLKTTFTAPGTGGLEDTRTAQEKEIGKLEDAYVTASNKVQESADKMIKAEGRLKELGFSAADVMNLINPKPADSIVGTGDPHDGDKDDKIVKEAEALNKKLLELKYQAEEASKTQDQREIDNIKKKYADILKEYEAFTQKAGSSMLSLSIQQINALQNEEVQATLGKQLEKISKQNQEAFTKASADEYARALKDSQEYYEKLSQDQSQALVNRTISQKTYEANVKLIQVESRNAQIRIAEDYSGVVKKASEDVTAFRIGKLKDETAAVLAEYAKQRENEKLSQQLQDQAELARAQRRVSTSAPGSDARLQAQKELLELERQQALAAVHEREKQTAQAGIDATYEFNQEREKINQEFNTRELDNDIAHLQQRLDIYTNFASSIVNIWSKFNDATNANQNAQLSKELADNEKKKAAYKKQLDQKLITQQEYDARVNGLDVDSDKKKEKVERDQFERNKRLQIAMTIIDGARAIGSIWAQWPKWDGGPAMFAALAAAAASTIGQLAAISKTKYEKGGEFGRGGRLTGPAHSEGGMPVINPRTGQVEAEMEGGEVILSKKTVRNNAALVNQLLNSSLYRGGETIRPFWQSRAYESFNYPIIAEGFRKMANGGFYAGAAETGYSSTPQDNSMIEQSNALTSALLQSIAMLNRTLASGIDARVSLDKIDSAKAIQQNIQNNSALG